MDIGIVDFVGIAVRLSPEKGQQLVGGGAVDPQIHGFSVHMLAVFHTALESIPLGAPQTADDMAGSAEMPPGGICQTDHRFLHPSGETAAVFSAAFASEFRLIKEFDGIPEAFAGNLLSISGNGGFQRGIGFRASQTVIREAAVPLESGTGIPAELSPIPVNAAAIIA